MSRTKFDRLWDGRVQQERIRAGRERAQRKYERAMARRALQDRFEPCPVLAAANATLPIQKHHAWRYMPPVRGQNSRREECIFCGVTRPYIDRPGSFGAPNVGRVMGATEIQASYRDGNGGEWTIDGPMISYPPPTKGAKG